MADIIRFPGHKWARCRSDCEGCCLCEGGLSLCTVCGGGEGSLPTDCPGKKMTVEVESLVYSDQLDYTRQLGWHKRFLKSKG